MGENTFVFTGFVDAGWSLVLLFSLFADWYKLVAAQRRCVLRCAESHHEGQAGLGCHDLSALFVSREAAVFFFLPLT